MPNSHAPSAVFFDMDGTLHKEDSFVAFLLFIARVRFWAVLVFLPIIVLALIIFTIKPKGNMGLNLLLFALLFGLSQHKLDKHIQHFAQNFCQTATFFDSTQTALQRHLADGRLIFIITGTPTTIAHTIYHSISKHPNVHIIGSTLAIKKPSIQLGKRCFGDQKPIMLHDYLAKLPSPPTLPFAIGYSDSRADLPMMALCLTQVWVNKMGEMGVVN